MDLLALRSTKHTPAGANPKRNILKIKQSNVRCYNSESFGYLGHLGFGCATSTSRPDLLPSVWVSGHLRMILMYRNCIKNLWQPTCVVFQTLSSHPSNGRYLCLRLSWCKIANWEQNRETLNSAQSLYFVPLRIGGSYQTMEISKERKYSEFTPCGAQETTTSDCPWAAPGNYTAGGSSRDDRWKSEMIGETERRHSAGVQYMFAIQVCHM